MTDVDPVTDGSESRLPRLPEPRRNGTRAGGVTERLEQLEDRLVRLERVVWGDCDEPALDITDPELLRLARSADRAHELTRMLVEPDVRFACEQAISVWEHWHRRHREVLDTALAASRTIAITSSGQQRRTGAVGDFEAAREELAGLRQLRQGYLNAAIHARRQLARDEDVRDRSQREIDAGHQDWTALCARLKLRVASAVDRGEPLPAWLVVTLGPPSATSGARWRDLATELLAYRITYAVTERTGALGPEPTADDSPRRRRWYTEMEQRLARWVEAT